ncbi:HEAT repeat domain-containing protein, partial [Streptomyces sp. NPDC059762]|uniref:HEAT repeat domain-containing protein n=1 Tax=Streptomyces sp. NPDC059762 TaxID=3346938 RepID=UPI0036685901
GAGPPAPRPGARASPGAGGRAGGARPHAAPPADAAPDRLRHGLGHPDPVVRGQAALALGGRGEPGAIPELVEMVVDGRNDTDAADALGALATDDGAADAIAARLVDRLADAATAPPARGRLTQALADIPGPVASRALTELTGDDDPAVALTATYLRRLRDTP